MPGPRCCCCFFITTLTALLSSSNAFSLGLPRQVKPLGPPLVYLLQEEGPTQPRSIQKVLRTKRNSVQELVQTQPHQGQYTGRPETHKASRSQEMDTADLQLLSQPAMEENLGVEDEMERMIHLVVPQKEPSYRGPPDSSDPEKEPLAGPGAGDASLEASGYYGTDMEDRDRGEDEGEDRERRGGEEWEIDVGEDKERTGEDDDTHTSPDQEALIGSRRSNHTGPPAEGRDPGLQEQRGALVLKAERDLWEEDAHSSGDGDLHPSAPAATGGTPPPETDTGTDFGLLEGYTEDVQDEETERDEEEDQEAALPHRDAVTQNPTEAEVMVAPTRGFLQPRVEEEEEQEVSPLTAGPSPSFTEPSRDWLETTTSSPESEVRGSRASEVTGFDELEERQVTCVDWSKLSQQGSVLLNTTENLSCEEFRVACGVRLLKVIEGAFAQRMNSPEGSWQVHLNKPTHQLQQLMMNVVSEHGVMATKEVLSMLGEIRRMLNQVGIQTFSSPSTCRTGRSPTRSDYGKLFVVLVIIGSVCMIIITSGFLYICWQRHLPGTKTTVGPLIVLLLVLLLQYFLTKLWQHNSSPTSISIVSTNPTQASSPSSSSLTSAPPSTLSTTPSSSHVSSGIAVTGLSWFTSCLSDPHQNNCKSSTHGVPSSSSFTSFIRHHTPTTPNSTSPPGPSPQPHVPHLLSPSLSTLMPPSSPPPPSSATSVSSSTPPFLSTSCQPHHQDCLLPPQEHFTAQTPLSSVTTNTLIHAL